MVQVMKTGVGRARSRDEEGAVVVLTAIMMVVLILFVAIVVDLGNARDVRRQSQNAADAASLAGANRLYPATGGCSPGSSSQPCIIDAVAAVKSYALDNFQVSSWSGCNASAASALAYVPDPSNFCISFDSPTSPTLVRVYLPTRPVASFFGGIVGVSSIPVSSSAQAQLGTDVTCTLCFLGDVNAGNADFTVTGGSIAVNGNVTAGPGSLWNSMSNGVVGTVNGGVFSPPATPISAFTDPLATSLTLPLVTTGPPALTAKTDPCASVAAGGGPGLYGAFSLPDGPCTLQPGLYVISGTWDMKNNTVLDGMKGVTLYAKSSILYAASSSGYLDFKNGVVKIAAPLTAPFPGVSPGYAIIYDRDNTNNLGLQGNGGTSITGVVYAPASKLDFNGNSCFGFSGGPVIVSGVVMANGTKSCVTITGAVPITVSRTLLHLNQ